MIILRVCAGILHASKSAWYCLMTGSIPSRPLSDPNTIFMNALGSLSGVFTFHSGLCHSVFDHQKIFWKSVNRPCIFVSVEPLRSQNTLGFHRAISAAHSYSGLPQCAPSTVTFGNRRAISSR